MPSSLALLRTRSICSGFNQTRRRIVAGWLLVVVGFASLRHSLITTFSSKPSFLALSSKAAFARVTSNEHARPASLVFIVMMFAVLEAAPLVFVFFISCFQQKARHGRL